VDARDKRGHDGADANHARNFTTKNHSMRVVMKDR
jgi:hypothetical protein